jgi:beta-glucosidase
MGMTYYRMSISWSRIMPDGKLPLNQKGVDFYNRVIDTLLDNGIVPFVTLYHWDLPQSLANDPEGKGEGDKLFGKGWLDASIADDFVTYAQACYLQFGDRVQHWLTFNEPLTFVNMGYSAGIHAPGRCTGCSFGGNSAIEPYIVAHNVLRAHAFAVQRFRELKQSSPTMLDGKIGITLNCDWAEPFSPSEDDKEAAQRYLEFQLAWFADPVFFGKYPDSMIERVGDRLPQFTPEEAALIKGSYDFFGLNHYTSTYVRKPDFPAPKAGKGASWGEDSWTSQTATSIDGQLIGELADSGWLHVVPWGFRKMLNWVAERYGNPGIYVTENGCDVPNESNLPLQQALNDDFRVNFYRDYIGNMVEAMKDGVDVRGYFAWSLLDNFEWADGYSKRFGLHYVDYKDGLKRYRKKSASWFKAFIRANTERGAKSHRLRSPAPPATSRARAQEDAAKKRTLKASVLSAVLGFMGALVLVAALMTFRALSRHARSQQAGGAGGIEMDASGSGDEMEDDDYLSVRSDLLHSPRGVGMGSKSVSFSALPSPRGATHRGRSPLGSSGNLARLSASMSMGHMAHQQQGGQPGGAQATSKMGPPSKSATQLSSLTQRKSHTDLRDLQLQHEEDNVF